MAFLSSTITSTPPWADAGFSTSDPDPSTNSSVFVTKQELNDQLNLFSTKILNSIKDLILSTSSSTTQSTPTSLHLATHDISDGSDRRRVGGGRRRTSKYNGQL